MAREARLSDTFKCCGTSHSALRASDVIGLSGAIASPDFLRRAPSSLARLPAEQEEREEALAGGGSAHKFAGVTARGRSLESVLQDAARGDTAGSVATGVQVGGARSGQRFAQAMALAREELRTGGLNDHLNLSERAKLSLYTRFRRKGPRPPRPKRCVCMCTSFRNILSCMRSSRLVRTPSFPSGLLSVVGQPVCQQVCTSMHIRSGRSNELTPEGLPGNYARDCSTSSRSSTVTSSVAAAEDEEEGDDNNDEEE
ncbi:MAG: hypothetical protein ACPIOQ_17525, partial [Promethearchaeia archaeon]